MNVRLNGEFLAALVTHSNAARRMIHGEKLRRAPSPGGEGWGEGGTKSGFTDKGRSDEN